MKILYLIILSSFCCYGMDHVRTQDPQETFEEALDIIRLGILGENLTCKAVAERIFHAQDEEVPLLSAFVEEEKDDIVKSAEQITKSPHRVTDKKIESTFAALGILKWAELEARQKEYLIEKYMRKLHTVKCMRALLAAEGLHETSV